MSNLAYELPQHKTEVQFLSDEFISKYPNMPAHMNAIGTFVYYRTYSRYLPKEKRREWYKETCRRAVEYNIRLAYSHLVRLGYGNESEIYLRLVREAEEFFDSMFNLGQFLSGRTMWVGGAENGVADKYPLANFNCSFTDIDKWEDLGELFYLLLVGTGVGYRCFPDQAEGLRPIRTNFTIAHDEYRPVHHWNRSDHTSFEVVEESAVRIRVGDSKEGWVAALNLFFNLLTSPQFESITQIIFNYDFVRPKGERLKTFGGTASGPDPLLEMFQGFSKVLKNEIDSTLAPLELAYTSPEGVEYFHVRPIHILDMGNLVGNNVVVGGVRRTAEIFLMSADDWECIWAKYGINGFRKQEHFDNHNRLRQWLVENNFDLPEWFDKFNERFYDETVNIDYNTGLPNHEEDGSLSPYNFARPLYHRGMSNNSIAFERKPSYRFLSFVFQMMQAEGEPGFINLEEVMRRAPGRRGLNPCAEILLGSKGVCNLTTVNVLHFVKKRGNVYYIDAELFNAQRRSARAGLRMTLVDLELPEWDAIQKRDRLTGTSLTGWKDAMDLLGFDEHQELNLLNKLGKIAREESGAYAKELRVPAPLLVTTIKPEGTLSQVAGGVSSGLHYSHAPYYIRRIRINAADPLAKAVLDLGWKVNPENGTPGNSYEEKMQNARTLVIDFPIKSGAKRTKDDVSAAEQFDTYFKFQSAYTEHNSSNTITVRPHEWVECLNIVWSNWDRFTAVSFLALDGGTYQLAPYETIDKERYNQLVTEMKPFDFDLLAKYEVDGDTDLEGAEGCDNGVCPIR